MKLLTDTEIPVLHHDGRVVALWRFSAGRAMERTRWYPMFVSVPPLCVPEPELPKVNNFEAELCFLADGHLVYLCRGLDIAPERAARILRNVRVLAELVRHRVGRMPVAQDPKYHWHLDFEGNVQTVSALHAVFDGPIKFLGPWPDWHYRPVVVRPGESNLDLSIEALAAVSAWDLLLRQQESRHVL